MNTLFIKSTLASAIALTIVSCTPAGSGGVAGIGGSGYVSSGSVSGFGSVFVNGVEFETDSSTFDVDGVSGTQDDLAIGMIVQVSGTINDDGITGNASHISFDDELQGPVSALTDPDADGITRSFTVLGIKVIIDSGSTSFDVSSELPPGTAFNFDNIANNNNVEISGFFDSSGALKATRAELKNIIYDTDSVIEIEGKISALSDKTFKIGSLTVDASTAELDDLPNGLENDLYVEVKGTLDDSLTILIASKVEAEDNSVDDADEFEIEGIISGYNDTSKTFVVNGISVDASTAELEPASLVLADDIHVEVEGAIVNGTLIATEIESEGGEIKVHAPVTAIDTDAGTFEVTPNPTMPGQTITVTVTTGTQLESDVDESDEQLSLSSLVVDNFVEVQGYENDSGSITATEVEVKEISEVLVQGYATAANGVATNGTMTVLGVTFSFNSSTEFEKDSVIEGGDDEELDTDEINNLITAILTEPQLVSIKDKNGEGNPVGIADEIEIESP